MLDYSRQGHTDSVDKHINLFIYIFILELVEENKMLTEMQAAIYFKQIVETIKYCHSKNVTLGRNIKLMNCVFDDKR